MLYGLLVIKAIPVIPSTPPFPEGREPREVQPQEGGPVDDFMDSSSRSEKKSCAVWQEIRDLFAKYHNRMSL